MQESAHPYRLIPNILSDRGALSLFFISLLLLSGIVWSVEVLHFLPGRIQAMPVFLSADDAYRYFFSLQAFHNPDLYHWSYIQPVALLFDGLLAVILQHNIIFMRLSHALLTSISLVALYRASRHLGIRSGSAFAATISVLLMPIYAAVSISFYGESLLAADLCFLIYFYSRDHQPGMTATAAIAPLIRPEGLIFLLFILLDRLTKKRFRQCLLILLPGILYGAYLLATLPTADTYFQWRLEFSAARTFIFQQLMSAATLLLGTVPGNLLLFFSSLNFIWWGLAAAGMVLSRRHWPIYGGAVVCVAFQAIAQIIMSKGFGEARYLVAAVPAMALAIAACIDRLWTITSSRRSRRVWELILILLIAAPVVENFGQIDAVRYQFFSGHRWFFLHVPAQQKNLVQLRADYTRKMQLADLGIRKAIDIYPEVNSIIIGKDQFLKSLNPAFIGDRKVVLAPISGPVSWRLFKGYIFGMAPTLPQYQYYRFFPEPTPNDTPVALYVGRLPPKFRPLFGNHLFRVYKVHFKTYRELPASTEG